MAEEIKFRGVPVFMGGREYIVPSLSVRQFRDNREMLTQPIVANTEEEVSLMFERYIPIIGMVLRRNYPEVTNEELLDLLDMATFKVVMAAVTAASGLRAAKPGEAAPVA